MMCRFWEYQIYCRILLLAFSIISGVMTYLCHICIFTIICMHEGIFLVIGCIVTAGSATTLYTENTANEENNSRIFILFVELWT